MPETNPRPASVEFVVRINGEHVRIDLADLVCVRITEEGGRELRVLPGTVGRALQLGAAAIVAETHYSKEFAEKRALLGPPGPDDVLFK